MYILTKNVKFDKQKERMGLIPGIFQYSFNNTLKNHI